MVDIEENEKIEKNQSEIFSKPLLEKEPVIDDSNFEAIIEESHPVFKEPLKSTTETNLESVKFDEDDAGSKNDSVFSDFETKNDEEHLNEDSILEYVVIDSDSSDLEAKKVSQIELEISDILKDHENKTIAKINEILEGNEIKKIGIKKRKENDSTKNDTVRPLESKIDAKKDMVKPNATLKKTTLKVDIVGPKIVKAPKGGYDILPNSTDYKITKSNPKIDDQVINENNRVLPNSTSFEHEIEKSNPKSAINITNKNKSFTQTPKGGYDVLPNSTASEYKNITILEPTKFGKKENLVAINYVYIFSIFISAFIIPIIIGTILFFCCRKEKKFDQNIELGEIGKDNEEKAEVSDNTNTSEL